MKQRKPILALLVAAALLPWLTVSARAADTDVMFSDPSVVVGNTVTVNVYTTSAVAGIDLTLVYDTDYLTYTGASGGLGNAAVQDNGGSLRIVDYSGSGEGKFSLNLSFTARAIGTTALRPTACSASNAGGDAVSVEYASHSASVTITSASSDCTLSALYIRVPGIAHIVEEIVLQDTVRLLQDWLAALLQDRFSGIIQQRFGCPLLAPADLHDGLLDCADQCLVLAAFRPQDLLFHHRHIDHMEVVMVNFPA